MLDFNKKYKIRVTETNSKATQKALFKLGFTWYGGQHIRYEEYRYFYLNTCKAGLIEHGSTEKFFNSSSATELSASVLIGAVKYLKLEKTKTQQSQPKLQKEKNVIYLNHLAGKLPVQIAAQAVRQNNFQLTPYFQDIVNSFDFTSTVKSYKSINKAIKQAADRWDIRAVSLLNTIKDLIDRKDMWSIEDKCALIVYDSRFERHKNTSHTWIEAEVTKLLRSNTTAKVLFESNNVRVKYRQHGLILTTKDEEHVVVLRYTESGPTL